MVASLSATGRQLVVLFQISAELLRVVEDVFRARNLYRGNVDPYPVLDTFRRIVVPDTKLHIHQTSVAKLAPKSTVNVSPLFNVSAEP
jgi:hypothetical protein